MEDIEKLLAGNMRTHCPRCNSTLKYAGMGEYRCSLCGFKVYDDYGRIVNYVKDHGGSSIPKISKATGVSEDVISILISKGKFGAPDGVVMNVSKVCKSCGKIINTKDKYCEACKKSILNNIKDSFANDAKNVEPNRGTGMRFHRKKSD